MTPTELDLRRQLAEARLALRRAECMIVEMRGRVVREAELALLGNDRERVRFCERMVTQGTIANAMCIKERRIA